MATIGSFKKVGNDFHGEIITLSLQAKASGSSSPRTTAPMRTLPPTACMWAGPR